VASDWAVFEVNVNHFEYISDWTASPEPPERRARQKRPRDGARPHHLFVSVPARDVEYMVGVLCSPPSLPSV